MLRIGRVGHDGTACIRTAVLVMLVTVAGLVVCGRAQAQHQTPSPVVAIIVDVQQAQRESSAGKALIAQRDKFQQSLQAEFNATRQNLQASDQELAKLKGTIAQSAFDEKAKALELQVVAFQRRTQVAVRALEKSTEIATAELMNGILGITGEIANEMGANLVLPKQQVVLHQPHMDVTGQVIERLNRRLPTIIFPVPVVDEPSAPPTPAKPAKK